MSFAARVLIVEDDFLLSADLADKLGKIGCEVAGTAFSGSDAVNLARSLRPDLALMDIRLKGTIDGITAAETIRKECRIPIIFVSGVSDELTLSRTAQSGAFGHLVKPVREQELKTTIALALGQSREWRNLLSRNSWFAALLDSIEEGVVAVNQTGRLSHLNSQAEYMTGWTLAETEGKPIELLYAPLSWDGVPLTQSRVRQAAERGEPGKRKRMMLQTRQGNRIPIEETVNVIRKDGEPCGALAVFRDIADSVRIQEADKLQSIGTLAAGVAHDFNNLLAVIVGNTSLVREHLPADSADRAFLEDVIKAGARAAELTSQLLSYAGQSSVAKAPVDLSRMVRDMEATIRTVVQPDIEITFDTPAGLPVVHADARQLRQVLMNLVSNAAEAIGERAGLIAISTGTADPDAVVMRVCDDGCGMDSETRAKAFDPFFSTRFLGRGLGLAAVEGIVRAHGGAIDVHTEPQQGSTFTVMFPAVRGQTPGRPADSSARTSGTVLVVDDVEGVWRFAKTTLERAGFKVLTARDGKSAVEVVRNEADSIDIILLDLSMPGYSGVEAAKEIARLAPSLPICYMSGYSEESAVGTIEQAELSGCFLQKPFTPRQLIAKLQHAIEVGGA